MPECDAAPPAPTPRDQRRIEEIRRNEECFRQLAEHIQEVFWMTNPDTTELIYISPAYEAIWGRSCEALYRNPGSRLDAVHPDDHERVHRTFARNSLRGEYDETFRILRPDGEVRWIRDRAFPVRNHAGDIYRLAGIAIDITGQQKAYDENRKLQARLAAFDRLSAVAALGSGMAHDVSQPLTAAIGFLAQGRRLIERESPDPNRLRPVLDRANREITRAGELISHLRQFARHGEPIRQPHDLETLVRNTVDLVDVRLREHNVRLEMDLATPSPRVMVDPVFFQQIMINLINNALDAMNGIEKERRWVQVVGHPVDEGFADIVVSDHGMGLDERALEQLFNPFYTTKKQGLGLGLAASRLLAEALGGSLQATQNYDTPGASFCLRLPLAGRPDGTGDAQV